MIYFVAQQDYRFVKIGYVADKRTEIGNREAINSRLSTLQTGNPHKLVLVAAIPGNIPDEQALHRLFGEYSVNGEWFLFMAPMLRYIQQRTDQINMSDMPSADDVIQRMIERYQHTQVLTETVRQ